MSDTTWGVPDSGAPGSSQRKAKPPTRGGRGTGARGLSPQASVSAHSGIVWLHLSAIVLWIGVAGILAVVGGTGREIPVVVFVACLGAAAGHALFLGMHSLFASAARRRAIAPSPAPAPAPVPASGSGDGS